jgi:hypothetical protein
MQLREQNNTRYPKPLHTLPVFAAAYNRSREEVETCRGGREVQLIL